MSIWFSFAGVSLEFDQGQTVEEVIAESRYDEVEAGINSTNFPLTGRGEVKATVFLNTCTTREFTPMIQAVNRERERGSRSFATAHHLLVLGREMGRNKELLQDLHRCCSSPTARVLGMDILAVGGRMDPYLPFLSLHIDREKVSLRLRCWCFPPAWYAMDQFLMLK